MPEFLPFRGIRYSARFGGELTPLVAPPYDILSDADVARLYSESEYNVIRLDLGIAGDTGKDGWHEASGRLLAAWRQSGVLAAEERPAYYILRQTYSVPGGGRKKLTGVIGACRLTPWKSGDVLPHEHTFAKPKEDRLRLMRCTDANLSQVYGFYSDAELTVDKLIASELERPPAVAATDWDGGRHELWVLTDPERQRSIARALERRTAFIADGHHRYETALAFRDEKAAAQGKIPGAGWNYVMMLLVNLDAGGITILPTHRLINQRPVPEPEAIAGALEPWYAAEVVACGSAEGLERAEREVTEASGKIAIYLGGRWLWLAPKDREGVGRAIDEPLADAVRRLTVTALHQIVLPKGFGIDKETVSRGGAVEYLRSAREGTGRVDAGEAGALVYLPAPTPRDVLAVAEARAVMPHKSTYFYPKLLTGLVINDLTIPVSKP